MGEGAWDDQHLVNMAPNEFLEKVIPREILEWSVKYSLDDVMRCAWKDSWKKKTWSEANLWPNYGAPFFKEKKIVSIAHQQENFISVEEKVSRNSPTGMTIKVRDFRPKNMWSIPIPRMNQPRAKYLVDKDEKRILGRIYGRTPFLIKSKENSR